VGVEAVGRDEAAVTHCAAQHPAAGGGADCHSQAHGHWIVDTPIANPSSYSADLKTSRKAWGIDALGTVVAEVELTNGVKGVGISIGGEPACYIIENHLARFVEGQDVHNTELMWEQMFKVRGPGGAGRGEGGGREYSFPASPRPPNLQATLNYGRKGLPLQAISAVDLALWDALGKVHGVPVYQLLGGKTKERLPVYATSTRPDLSKAMGFVGGKFPLPYGPADGDAGMRANIERVKAVSAHRWRRTAARGVGRRGCNTHPSPTPLIGAGPRVCGPRLPHRECPWSLGRREGEGGGAR